METHELLAAVLASGNLSTAWWRVKANNGAPGIDGIRIEDFSGYPLKRFSLATIPPLAPECAVGK